MPAAAAPSDARPLSRTAAWALALTATLTMAVSYVDRQTLSAICAQGCRASSGIDDNAYAQLGMAFAAAYLVGAPVAEVAGRPGRRPGGGLLGAVLVWSGVAALHALVPGFGVLFGMRVLLGLAERWPSFPGMRRADHPARSLPPRRPRRRAASAWSSTGSSIGAARRALIAPRLAAHFGFRAAFLGTAAAGLLWVPVWLAVAYTAPARAALDRRQPTAAPGERPISPFRLAVHPAVLRAVVAVMASAPLLTLFHQWGTKYLVHDRLLDLTQAGDLLWAPPLFFDVGALLFGHLASNARVRGAEGVPRPLLAVAAVLMLAGAAIPYAPTPAIAVAAMCAAMVGGGGMYALPMSDVAVRVPPGLVSSAGGVCAAAQSIAQIATNAAIGVSVTRTGNYTTILIALAAWVAPGALLWIAGKPPRPYAHDA